MDEYIKYQHVEKLGSDEVDGLLIGTCYVFPKLDGTNAHVWWDKDKGLRCGSRNRELALDNDNAGFMNWAILQEQLERLTIETGWHIFGEWLVPHSLKTYRDDAWRKFYVFDAINTDGNHVSYEELAAACEGNGYQYYIPPIRIIKNPTIENIERCLDENTFLMQHGNSGEGVVVKNYSFVNKFGRQTWGKLVTSEFKEKHNKTMGAPICSGTKYVEEEIATEFVTLALVEKTYANIKNETGWNSKNIPQLLGVVFYDLIREHAWDFVKKHKNPKIDFKTLQKFTNARIKELMPNLF